MTTLAVNPFLPSWEYIPDGEPRIFGDRLYLFGSHDRFGGRKYCMNDYVVWSAPVNDLGNWTSHGVAYRKNQDPGNPNGKIALWAPDVVQGADGRFYLYYGMQFVPRMSVAVADAPEGPYEFHGHVTARDGAPLGSVAGQPFPFDPGVLVDDDGQVYLYFGFAPDNAITSRVMDKHKLEHEGAYVVALEPDMTTIAAGPRLIVPMAGKSEGSGFEGHEFFEAASIRKIGNTYYFVYSSIHGHELCYATSSRPSEGFRFGGVLISNGDIGLNGRAPKDALNYTANNHGSLVEIDGQWYIFYHRHTNRDQVSRQAAAEPIAIDGHGQFAQAEMTSSGLHNGPLPGIGEYPARIACVLQSAAGAKPVPYLSLFRNHSSHPYFTQTGRDREGDGDQYIANLRDGAVAGFKYFDLAETRSIVVDARRGDGKIFISTELDGAPIASVRVPTHPGLNRASIPEGLGGRTALYFRYRGTGATDFHAFTLGGASEA